MKRLLSLAAMLLVCCVTLFAQQALGEVRQLSLLIFMTTTRLLFA